MKICQLQDFSRKGGASIAANRISKSVDQNHEIIKVSSDFDTSNELEGKIALQNGRIIRLLDLVGSKVPKSILKKLRMEDLNRQLRKILGHLRPELINIHNLHGAAWSVGLTKTALKYSPVVWTLHDCWSYTGAFYKTHSPKPSNQIIKEIESFWNDPAILSSRSRLTAVAPSQWMNAEAKASYWNKFSVKTIHNPVPDFFFVKRDRIACKQALGLNLDKPVVLSIAGNLDEKRKGGPILSEILKSELVHKCQIVLIGSGNLQKISYGTVSSLGFIQDEIAIRMAYQAADLLVHPAPIDNLPNTVAEAMSCDCPVLAFQTGGLPEMIVTGQSGWLAPLDDKSSIINALNSIIETKAYSRMTGSTRNLAKNLFGLPNIGQEYSKFFGSLKVN